MNSETLRRIVAENMAEAESEGDDPLVGYRFHADRNRTGLVVARLDPGEYLVSYDGDRNPGLRVVHTVDMKAWRFFQEDKDLHAFEKNYRSQDMVIY